MWVSFSLEVVTFSQPAHPWAVHFRSSSSTSWSPYDSKDSPSPPLQTPYDWLGHCFHWLRITLSSPSVGGRTLRSVVNVQWRPRSSWCSALSGTTPHKLSKRWAALSSSGRRQAALIAALLVEASGIPSGSFRSEFNSKRRSTKVPK